jgi:hypothetical protein
LRPKKRRAQECAERSKIFAKERHRAFHKIGQISRAKSPGNEAGFAGNPGTVPRYPAGILEFERFGLLG